MKSTTIFTTMLLLAASAAQAQSDPTVVASTAHVRTVRYETSELASQAGIRGLQSRVRHAAREVCEPSPTSFAPSANTNELRCFHWTLRDAFAQVDQAVARWRDSAGIAMSGNIAVGAR